ncbi:hypothetical protein KXD98_06840 [Mycobacterium sp. SMC-4]|nr:hypothetical protein KXD98_06840 [Mycobacterium sp. SMC-4]
MAVRLRARIALGACVLLALTGCQQQQTDTEDPAPRPALEVRHDTEELARIFPPLGEPLSASWITWDNTDLADGSAVRVVWTDAVVDIAPETMTDLVEGNYTEESDQRPAVQKVLEPAVPPGPFRTGVDLNIIFGANENSTRVFLDEQTNTVVLQSYRMERA